MRRVGGGMKEKVSGTAIYLLHLRPESISTDEKRYNNEPIHLSFARWNGSRGEEIPKFSSHTT